MAKEHEEIYARTLDAAIDKLADAHPFESWRATLIRVEVDGDQYDGVTCKFIFEVQGR